MSDASPASAGRGKAKPAPTADGPAEAPGLALWETCRSSPSNEYVRNQSFEQAVLLLREARGRRSLPELKMAATAFVGFILAKGEDHRARRMSAIELGVRFSSRALMTVGEAILVAEASLTFASVSAEGGNIAADATFDQSTEGE